MIWQLSTGFAVICTLVQSACCYDTSSDVSNLPWPPSVMSSLLSICTIVCIIAVIMACAKWCPRETAEFKDFDNDGFFSDVTIQPPTTDIPMIPPVSDSEPTVTIEFERLPDVGVLRPRGQRSEVTGSSTLANVNASQLRPKIAQIGHDKVDSDDEGETLTDDMLLLQERVKLEKILSNTERVFERLQLQYIRELGTGWFGKVLLADGQDILPGHRKSRVVVLRLHENADQHAQYMFLQEAAPYRDMEHANVLKMIGQCVEMSPFLTVLEPCPHGDVKSYMRSHRSDHDSIEKQGLLLNIACDMASGLQALHHSNFVHRPCLAAVGLLAVDFALRNCLVSSDLTVKVGDYGLAEEIFKDDYYMDASNNAVPIRWLAPEVVEPSNGSVILRHITKDCNLWSFGVALWELVTYGGLPYTDLSNDQVIQLVIGDGSVRLCQPEVPVSNLDRLYQLMSLCWLAPAQRPSLRELRIMLLHLRSSRDELEAAEFDRRWNQLMPRSAAAINTTLPSVITSIADDEEAEMQFSLAPTSAHPKRSLTDIPNTVHSVLPAVHSFPGPGIPDIVRPASFDSEFGSEFNASLLAHAGSLQTSLHSLSTSPGNTPDDATLDDSFTAMAPRFSFTGNEHSLATNLTATSQASFAFEMVSYEKAPEAEAAKSEKEIKVDFDVNVPDSSSNIPPSTAALSTEQVDVQKTAEDKFDSGDGDWQSYGDSSPNQKVNDLSVSAADQKIAVDSKTDSGEVPTNASNNVNSSSSGEGRKNISAVDGECSHNTESDVGRQEQPGSKDGSFCMLKVSVSEDDLPMKSLDFESPAKSTTSSADWCLVSNHTDHSTADELDTVSQVTDPSLPGDCVLVESKAKVAPDAAVLVEASNDDIGSTDLAQNTPEGTEQPVDDTAEHLVYNSSIP